MYVSSGSCFQRPLNLTDSVLVNRCQNEKEDLFFAGDGSSRKLIGAQPHDYFKKLEEVQFKFIFSYHP